MGSVFEYVTIEKAAEALEVSVRTVYRYIEKGHLSTIKKGDHQLVSRQDVRALIDLRNQNQGPAINKTTVAKLHAKVQLLEKQLDAVMRILDIRTEPLKLSAPELVSLYEMAQHHLQYPWSPHHEQMWCDTLSRFSLEDLEKLSELIDDDHPWRPFHALAKAMMQNPHDVDIKIQLSAAKNNIERIGYIWGQTVTKDNAKRVNRLIERDDKQVRKISRKIERIKSKNE